jgi:hypothetical protein
LTYESDEQRSKKNRERIIFILIIVAIVLVTVAIMATLQVFVLPIAQIQAIQMSELPYQLLNGYDLICKGRDHMELCLYNQTSNTTFGSTALKLATFGKNGTSKIINVIQIKSVGTHCLKEFHVDYKNWNNNNTQLTCLNSISFDKSIWVYSIAPHNIIAFENSTQVAHQVSP